MQNVPCPSCGAPVEFRSHASVMAVCEYCRASVVKDAESVRDLGKMSEVLEDYSPIQIGTAGAHGGRAFTVIGRIQLRYPAGIWNEWYLLFDDGGAGWLGDASGQFMLTVPQPNGWTRWPAFGTLYPGKSYLVGDTHFTAADVREADCTGGQGELPFRVGAGWKARVADFRRGREFATLDYSDGDTPQYYKGHAVTLDELKCQLLRDDEAIKASAGKYRGRVESLQCPSCGTAIGYLPGMAANLVCPSCTTRIDAATPQAEVLAKGEKASRSPFTLPLGAVAKIGAKSYRVLGAMVRQDDEGATWSEYLMFTPNGEFFWLVETSEGWSRAEVIGTWPTPAEFDVSSVQYGNSTFRHEYTYQARVGHVVGAFNWRVSSGELARVAEFKNGKVRLAAELVSQELTWSRSTPVSVDQLRAWFGTSAPSLQQAGQAASTPGEDGPLDRFVGASLWLLGLNAVPLLFDFSSVAVYLVIGIVALLPLLMIGRNKSKSDNKSEP